jgi:hypothetical protein
MVPNASVLVRPEVERCGTVLATDHPGNRLDGQPAAGWYVAALPHFPDFLEVSEISTVCRLTAANSL